MLHTVTFLHKDVKRLSINR